MRKAIISDTSCFVVFTNIGCLELLKTVYGGIITTPEVANEYSLPLPEWVEIIDANDKAMQQLLEQSLDKGEASAITLALEIKDCTIILDDYLARKTAEKLNLDLTGTVGVLIKAKNNGAINSIKPYLEKLKNTNFRLTPAIFIEALKLAGEEGEE